MYSVGFLVAYLTVLFVVAEPLRNSGKYTMADVLAYRLKPRPVRAAASVSTLTVSVFYMIAQMVGAGALVVGSARGRSQTLRGTRISDRADRRTRAARIFLVESRPRRGRCARARTVRCGLKPSCADAHRAL